ncbi:MAG TPA: hypothetical protein VFL31_03925, partial [Nitrospiraceae bacterium]|nr:hypothetical protein [Nitrospiraceae bacterium]
MAPGSTADGDEIPGVNGRDGNNDVAWNAVKGRVEGGKRGESINDPLNPDFHMGLGFNCSHCHNLLSGSFEALTDSSGNVIQPAIDVQKIDHQFAKGDNQPDGKNMDQLDNTVTCEGCHIAKTHVNSYGAPVPTKAHTGFPALHFEKISCKTCHIPILNGPMDQDVADFLTGPFQTFERTQTTQAPTGVNRKPLYMWRKTEHGKGHMEIQPFGIMAVGVWANATSLCDPATDPTCNLGECGSIVPTYQRLGKKSAELLRALYGDANGDGIYDWTLNRAQGGDTALIVNKPQEIADFITQMGVAGGPANPVMHFYFNQFAVSHNVRPKSAASNKILGSQAGGGCVMCHSSSVVGNPNYNAASVGFFDKTFEIFKQPLDGGQGLVQTSLPTVAPLPAGDLERINIKFPIKKADASSSAINLSNAAGQTVGNTLNQGEVLGYDAARVSVLTNPDTASFTITASADANCSISPSGAIRVPGMTDQTYTITANTGYRVANVVVDGVSKGALTTYTFNNVSADHTISVSCAVDAYSISAQASLYGSISPSGTVTVASGGNGCFFITPVPGAQLTSCYVDGTPVTPIGGQYCFTNVTANHKIKCYFAPDKFTVTASAGTGCTITPSGSLSYNAGATQRFVISPPPGYYISSVLVDGVPVGVVTEFTFTNINANHTISAFCEANPTLFITATAGPNGSISPAGISPVVSGGFLTYMITPNSGYHIANVLIDGVAVGPVTTYSFVGITASHTISASFTQEYQIEAYASLYGSISPSGTTTVQQSTDKTYTITANPGHVMTKVYVDGVDRTADVVDNAGVKTYTFTNVSA